MCKYPLEIPIKTLVNVSCSNMLQIVAAFYIFWWFFTMISHLQELSLVGSYSRDLSHPWPWWFVTASESKHLNWDRSTLVYNSMHYFAISHMMATHSCFVIIVGGSCFSCSYMQAWIWRAISKKWRQAVHCSAVFSSYRTGLRYSHHN